MKHTNKILSLIAPAVLVATVAAPAFASDIVLSGSIACPGGNFIRKGGTEIHDRTYGLRNYNDDSVITITRVQAWDNDGTNTFDGLPNADGFKSTLNPHESARFNASQVLPVTLPPYNIQQISIDYTLDKPGMPLDAAYAHFVRNSSNYQVARNSGKCMHIPPGARHHRD